MPTASLAEGPAQHEGRLTSRVQLDQPVNFTGADDFGVFASTTISRGGAGHPLQLSSGIPTDVDFSNGIRDQRRRL